MASSPTRRTPSRFPPPWLDAAHLSYGRWIATTSESGVVHHAPRGEPPPLRGAAGVLRRRADPRRGRRAVRLHSVGDGEPGPRAPGRADRMFAPARKPGPAPGSAPAKDRARARVIELRRAGLSTYEISARLPGEGTPLNRTSVAEILAEEGFGRLLRRPEPAESTSPATPGRDTRRPRTARLDFATWPATVETGKAGLLLVVPDLIALDLPALVTQAGYPGTRVVPAVSWLLSLLALKLTRTRRVSHVDDLLLADPAAALFAGLSTLPKKSALTDYSYRTSHEHQRHFLAALDTAMIHGGLATSSEAIFDLDFHAVMHWGHDPVLEKHYVPTRSQRARSVLTFFAQDSGTHNLVYTNADLAKACL